MRFKKRRRSPLLIWGLIGAVVICSFLAFEKNLKPTAISMAQYYSKNTAEEAMNRGIEEVVNEFEGVELVSVSRSSTGEIESVEANMLAVNRMKLKITDQILENLRFAGTKALKIPMGTLFGSSLFSGWGPSFTYRFIPQGSVETRIVSQFESSGINQTRHQILLQVSVQAGALLSPYEVKVEVPTEYVLAETVLVGKVPDSYTHVLTDDQQLLSEINDYGAGTAGVGS